MNIGVEIFILYIIYEMSCFYIPEPLANHITNFMNTIWNENSFQILFITNEIRKKRKKNTDLFFLFPIVLPKTGKRRCVTYHAIGELRQPSLSKIVHE